MGGGGMGLARRRKWKENSRSVNGIHVREMEDQNISVKPMRLVRGMVLVMPVQL